jgi:hypothetical protein
MPLRSTQDSPHPVIPELAHLNDQTPQERAQAVTHTSSRCNDRLSSPLPPLTLSPSQGWSSSTATSIAVAGSRAYTSNTPVNKAAQRSERQQHDIQSRVADGFVPSTTPRRTPVLISAPEYWDRVLSRSWDGHSRGEEPGEVHTSHPDPLRSHTDIRVRSDLDRLRSSPSGTSSPGYYEGEEPQLNEAVRALFTPVRSEMVRTQSIKACKSKSAPVVNPSCERAQPLGAMPSCASKPSVLPPNVVDPASLPCPGSPSTTRPMRPHRDSLNDPDGLISYAPRIHQHVQLDLDHADSPHTPRTPSTNTTSISPDSRLSRFAERFDLDGPGTYASTPRQSPEQESVDGPGKEGGREDREEGVKRLTTWMGRMKRRWRGVVEGVKRLCGA